MLFDILEMQDDYIEIPLIVKEIRVLDTLVKGFDICFSCLLFKSLCIVLK